MYDVERISKIIDDIERLLRDLQELDIKKVSDMEDRKSFYAVSMVLFSILNRTINIGEELVAANNLGMPSTYKEIFELLAKNKLITINLGRELSKLVFYRNLLSHEYYRLSTRDVFDILKKLGTIAKFVNRTKELLR